MTFRSKILWFRGVFLELVLILVLCSSLRTVMGEESTALIVNGGYRGRVFGCECPGGHAGGIAHRAAALEDHFQGFLPVGLDAGGILDLDPDGGARRSRCAITGLALQGTRVLGVTPRDLFYGREFLEAATSQAGIELVSANIVNSQDSSRVFPLWSAHLLSSLKMAVTSLSDFQPGRRFTGVVGWIPLPPESVLSSLKKTIPPDANFLVLLTDIGEEKLRELIPKMPVFDLIVTSSRQIVTPNPIIIDNTTVIHPRTDGRALDYLMIQLNGIEKISYHSMPLPQSRRSDHDTQKWLLDCLENPEN